jgi:outer membrane protein OmpA-like peptidoglycan-associated protein
MKKNIVLLLGLILVFIPLMSATQNFKGFGGIFEVASPFTLNNGSFGFVFGVNNVDLETADIDVNRFYFGLGYGISDKIELSLNVSYNRVKKVDSTGLNFEYPYAGSWQTGLGYASLGAKFNLIKNENMGFGIFGHFDLPLSDDTKGVTTSKAKYGIDLLFSKKLSSGVMFNANAGYQLNQAPSGIDLGNTLKYSAGFEAKLVKSVDLITQISGKQYSGSNIAQDNPIDVVIGLKYENDYGFGVAVAYKKNLSFDTKGMGDTHGAMGSISYVTGKTPPPPPCNKVESVKINGENNAKDGESRTYSAVYSPDTVSKPVAYKWTCSDNGEIISGQGAPTVSVKWNKDNSDSWVKVSVSNDCSTVDAKLVVTVAKSLLPPKEEYFFALDSSDLCGSVKMDLDTAVKYLKYHTEAKIEIQGHTCSIATVSYNMGLGEERAQAVKKYLVGNGISPDRIKTISYGEEKPAYDNSKEETRRKNRRVYIPLKIKK